MAEILPEIETFAKIKVVGAGGSGGSAVNRMVRSKIRGVEFIAVNTDLQALHHSLAPRKIHIGKTITRGLGAGMDPEVGRLSAEENQNEIREMLMGADMVFITCGMGGGTGTGSTPVIARIAKELGALTVAVVTRPFFFEGAKRREIAEAGYENLIDHVDTVITVPNDRVLQIIEKKTSLLDSFAIVDDILRQAVQGISELITTPGLINVDFADVRAIMANAGSALMGIGEARGEDRAVQAVKAAISSPLLEMSIEGARGVLFTVTGNANLTMMEVKEAAEIIHAQADPEAKIIFGTNIDEKMEEVIKITVVATGFDNAVSGKPRTVSKAPPVRTSGSAAIALGLGRRDLPRDFPKEAPARVMAPKVEAVSTVEVSVPTISTVPANIPVAIKDKEPTLAPAAPYVSTISVSVPATVKTSTRSPDMQPVEEEDLEIPAFLRKKML